jgi:hypothetical protein
MQSAGGWSAEGVYVIPVGTPGSSSVNCTQVVTLNGSFTPLSIQCTATGTLTDLIIRFPIDNVDASRINCALYSGPLLNCVSTVLLIQPVTFQIWITNSANFTSIPSLSTKNSCPLDIAHPAGTNLCRDDWTNATTDIALVSMNTSECFNPASPTQCVYAYTWTPTGITGDMEIEFHIGPMTNTQSVTIDGFELKQTPGATCNGTAPPCFQVTPGPLEIPDVVSDIARNNRFAQLIGTGWGIGWNPGSIGPIETTIGFALSTTDFISTWPLPVSLRCNTWGASQKFAPTCPVPNAYFQNVGDYKFTDIGGEFAASALSVNKYGVNSVQISATSSGMTAGRVGYVTWGTGTSDMILLDSSVIGD